MCNRTSRRLSCALFLAAAATATVASSATAQSLYTWANSGSDWLTGPNWAPGGPPTTVDYAQFVPPQSSAVNPTLPSSTTVRQTVFGPRSGGGWTLSGSGTLTTGLNGGFDPNPPNPPLGFTGIYTLAGSGNQTIDVGDGASTSLMMGGLHGSSGGAMFLAANSGLTLSGNTVATVDPSLINSATSLPRISLRGGTLVLDNSAGNPAAQRLTTAAGSIIAAVGGGSALELRGATAGTSFSGLNAAISLGGGDFYLRTVQTGGGALSAAFSNISRATARHLLYVENVGSGFVGDAGGPTITSAAVGSNSNVTQTLNGIISSSTAVGAPWVMATNRATSAPNAVVTGRWANYSGGIVASIPTGFTGDFSGASSTTNVLFAPNSAGVVNLAANATVNSLVLEPTVSGVTLAMGSNKINSLGVAHSGANDLTVTGGSLLRDDSNTTARTLIVLDPNASLITDSNLASSANAVINFGGRGFLVLTGTSNQVPFTAATTMNLGGGVIRATTSNLVTTNLGINFRGGQLEFDVTGGNATVTYGVAGGSGNVSWSNAAGESATSDGGSGGFSAFSNTPGNTLTVNLAAGAQLNWNAVNFVSTFHALKFGSSKSNATVNFQNPLGLGTITGSAYRTRNIEVTRGAGNEADKTVLSGVISGVAGYDLVKTGTGVLETTAANTYAGNTVVQEGELRVLATNTGGGAFIANNGTLVLGASQNTSALVVAGGAQASVSANGSRVVRAANVSVAATGAVDQNDNMVVVDYTGTSPFTTIAGYLATGYNGGAWTGAGMTSGAAATAASTSDKTALGYFEATDLFTSFPANYRGQSLDATSVVVDYTLAGDATMDRTVNGGDFNVLASNFGASGKYWVQADFTFDGNTNSADFNVLAANFGKTLPGGPGASVPEPTGAAALLVLGGLAARRRRQS